MKIKIFENNNNSSQESSNQAININIQYQQQLKILNIKEEKTFVTNNKRPNFGDRFFAQNIRKTNL